MEPLVGYFGGSISTLVGHQKIIEAMSMSFQSERPHKRLRRRSMHHAATRGDIDTLRALLDAECDTSHVGAQDWAGRAPLMCAALSGHTDCVRLLLQRGADVNKHSWNGNTSAHYAAEHGHKEALLVLLDGGCDVDATDDLDMTPLMCAAQHGHTECAQLLLERGADASKFDLVKRTAVHHSLLCKDVETLRVLLAAAAGPPTLDSLFRVGYPGLVSHGIFSFALACGCRLKAPCRAIEATGASFLRPSICAYNSLPHLL